MQEMESRDPSDGGKGGEYLRQKKARGIKGSVVRTAPEEQEGFWIQRPGSESEAEQHDRQRLMGNYMYAEGILSFLRETDVGKVKAGVLERVQGRTMGWISLMVPTTAQIFSIHGSDGGAVHMCSMNVHNPLCTQN